MKNCCVVSVPPDSSFKAFALPVHDWRARLTAGLNRSIRASDHSLGHIEEEIAHQTRDLERALAQEAAQKKADQAPPTCPVCGAKLTRLTHGHERTVQTRLWPHPPAAHARLVPALQGVAFPGRSRAGHRRAGQRFTFGAGNGGAGRQ
jgi:hypothetical protein